MLTHIFTKSQQNQPYKQFADPPTLKKSADQPYEQFADPQPH